MCTWSVESVESVESEQSVESIESEQSVESVESVRWAYRWVLLISAYTLSPSYTIT